MKKNILLTTIMSVLVLSVAFGQTTEELEAQKKEKAAQAAELKSQLDAVNKDLADINSKLVVWPRWESGAFGTFGLGFNGFKNWVARDKPNINSSTVGIAVNGYANHLAKKYFWRNAINVNMAWIKFDDLDNPDDVAEYQTSADALNATSLFGYNLNKKIAASALGEYRTNVLSNFNNPGYLDLGVGATFTPINNLVIVVHPLNYNFVFAEDGTNFESSLGAKIVADYTGEIIDGLNWKTNLSTFQSYQGTELSNWTWINSFNLSVAKGLGVGLELGLRNNKQEAVAAGLTKNPVQTYYVIGLSYAVSAKNN